MKTSRLNIFFRVDRTFSSQRDSATLLLFFGFVGLGVTCVPNVADVELYEVKFLS